MWFLAFIFGIAGGVLLGWLLWGWQRAASSTSAVRADIQVTEIREQGEQQ